MNPFLIGMVTAVILAVLGLSYWWILPCAIATEAVRLLWRAFVDPGMERARR